ncbi:MAG: Cna domain protein [Bryobacterales bacterium]|nr:Cna domain protein [Bryobacterales bacterium]
MSISRSALFAAILIPALTCGLCAQVGSASLNVNVLDATGSAIPNATITLSGADQRFTRTAAAGAAGKYLIAALPPGTYRLSLKAAGFMDQHTSALELSSGQTGSLNITMQLAAQASQVSVQATAPILQTTSASLGSVVISRQVTELPLLGRSFLNAVALAPGTVPVQPAGSTTNHSPVGQSVMPSVFGQRQKDNNFLMDGVENRDPNLLGVALYPPPEAIAEMKIDSGVGSSAYGHASGATIDVVTKSGSNEWHGDGWEYLRNNVLDARSFFVPTIGPFRWNQFGGALGGPLAIPHLLSKTTGWYVFGYYEGVRIRQAANFTAFVPTPANLGGDLSDTAAAIYDPYSTTTGPNNTSVRQPFPGNKIPSSRLNASAVKLAQAIYPAPNLASGTIPGVNYLNNAGNRTDGNQWSARVDHQFGQRDRFFARYSGADNPSSGVSFPSLPGQTSDSLANVVVSDTHILSPSFIVTGRYGLITVDYRTGNQAPTGISDQTGLSAVFPKFQNTDFIPAITIPGYSGINFSASQIGPLRQHTFIGDAQKIAGEHTIEFGGSVVLSHMVLEDTTSTAVQFATTQTSNFTSATGNALASYLLATPDSARRQIGGSLGDLTSSAFGFYVQDTWRHRALTVNMGLRYDYNTPPVNKYGLGTFDYSTGRYVWDLANPVTGAAANIRRGGIQPDRNNFAPRLGIAWQLTPRTVVRSSFGIFYNSFGSNYIQASQSARGNWPFAFPQAVSNLNATTVNAVFPNPFPGNPTGSAVPLICAQCLNVERALRVRRTWRSGASRCSGSFGRTSGWKRHTSGRRERS